MYRVFYLVVIRACASVIFMRALPRRPERRLGLVEAIGNAAVRAWLRPPWRLPGPPQHSLHLGMLPQTNPSKPRNFFKTRNKVAPGS